MKNQNLPYVQLYYTGRNEITKMLSFLVSFADDPEIPMLEWHPLAYSHLEDKERFPNLDYTEYYEKGGQCLLNE